MQKFFDFYKVLKCYVLLIYCIILSLNLFLKRPKVVAEAHSQLYINKHWQMHRCQKEKNDSSIKHFVHQDYTT